jgi:tetratricopeptide (TPR) repeat protein
VPRSRLIALLSAGLLALVTLAVYLPAVRYGFFITDDDDYVTNNPMVQQGLSFAGLKWAFTTFHAANWHPLTWLSLMADYQCFQLNAGGYHLVNLLIHAANAGLLCFLLWRLTGLTVPAVIAGALFAWHPAHVESVAWISERKDVLSTCFGLLSFLSYAGFVREQRRRDYWLALAFFVLSLLAKPTLVTLPFLLLLLDYWPLQRWSFDKIPTALIREKIPFFMITAGSCVVTFMAQHNGHAVIALNLLPLHYRLENLPVAAARYLLEMLWPAGLGFIYPYRPIPAGRLLLSVIVLAAVSLLVWRMRERSRCWLTGWLWFLGALAPVIGLVQVGATSMADRYTYIPSMGLGLAVVFGLYEWPRCKRWLPWVAALPLAGCLLATETQLGYWRSSEAVMRHTIEVTRDNDLAHSVLAVILDHEDRPAETLAESREALRIDPGYYQLHFLAGNALVKLNQPAEALAEYRICLGHDPDRADLHAAAARALAAQGKLAEALPEFGAAERLKPRDPQPYLDLAKYYFQQGADDRAVEQLWSAVRMGPDDFQTLAAVAHYLAANTNDAARDGQSAVVLALEAKGLAGQPEPKVLDVLGMAFAATGDFNDAVLCAQKAVEIAAEQKDVDALRLRLELYQKQQPWRESFRATNAPAAPRPTPAP